jgi:LysM repeat protein
VPPPSSTPSASPTPTAAPTGTPPQPTASPTAIPTPTPTAAPTPPPRTYVVVKGDTLGAIAARFGTTPNAIAAANGISNPNEINPGQVLVIP